MKRHTHAAPSPPLEGRLASTELVFCVTNSSPSARHALPRPPWTYKVHAHVDGGRVRRSMQLQDEGLGLEGTMKAMGQSFSAFPQQVLQEK